MSRAKFHYCAVAALAVVTPACGKVQQSYCAKLNYDVARFMRFYNKNSDGKLSQIEWLAYESALRAQADNFDKQIGTHTSSAQIKRTFDDYDVDKDGYVTANEMMSGLCVNGVEPNATAPQPRMP